jgi:hypothetical protein
MNKQHFYERGTEHLTWQASELTLDRPTDYNCVYFAVDSDGSVAVTDSHHRDKVLWFTADEWDAFVTGVRENRIRSV